MRKEWRLFYATDFQSLMYPCFTFCRILGIFPYKINDSIFQASKPHYVLSIIIVSALCVIDLRDLYQSNIFMKITNFEVVTKSLDDNCYDILVSFITIVTFVLSSPRMRLLQTIMEISSTLPPESYQKLSRLIHAKDIFGLFYLIGTLFIYFYVMHNGVFNIMFTVYTVLLVFTMDMLYMNCVCILKACFKEINNNLLHMQKFIVNNEPRVPIMFYEHRNIFLIMNLKALKKQHLMISNTVQMLNTIFSAQLLATIVLTFSEIIFDLLYFNVVQYNKYDGLFINLNKEVGVILSGTMYYFTKIGLLVWSCETGKNQAQEIRTTIHDVLNISRDKQIKNE
ncbi:uncharacterized protein LOC112467545, partial [Temnothorax curvispinosus]|uniref:Uncharacterized protein LOC112467545 n=1 Tax=Temnothorax curvispinosus TaxID=300111 RepID=A0A6J1RCL1_9HYME